MLTLLPTAAPAVASAEPSENLVSRGMQKFKRNKVEESVQDFDRAREKNPAIDPYLWQRGLSLYYLEDYKEAASQFRRDVAVNPSDTEESIWAYLSEAQLLGPEKARERFLEVGQDRRPYMRAAYEAFQSGSGVDGMRRAGEEDPRGVKGSKFYSLLYEGLYFESLGDVESARAAILAACDTPYGRKSGDYMADLARVHCLRRGWQ